MVQKYAEKCYMAGCDNEVGFIESSFGIHYCLDCEKLFLAAKSKNIDTSRCKDKQDLIKQLEQSKK